MAYPYTPYSRPPTPSSSTPRPTIHSRTHSQSQNPSSPSSPYRPPSTDPYNAPVTRSRTLFYLSVRDSSGSGGRRYRKRGGYGEAVGEEGGEGEGLMGGAAGEGREGGGGGGLPPRWVDTTDEIEEIINRVKLKITALEKLHAKHVLPGFTDRSAEEREIEASTIDITRDLRKLQSLITNIRPASNERNEVTTAKNVQRGLAGKVQDLSVGFRKKQRVYMQKLQGHAIKNKDLLTASGAITLKGTDSLDELEDDLQVASDHQSAQTQLQRSSMEHTIRQRDHELTEIAKSITELADLFRDLSSLVVEQGTVLDCVEYNVEETGRQVKGAVEELETATKYQKSSGKWKCVLFLVLLVVAFILILIYKPRSLSSPSPDQPPIPPISDEANAGTDISYVHGRPTLRPPSVPTGRPKTGPIRSKTKRPRPTRPAGGEREGWKPRGRRRGDRDEEE